MRQVCAVTVVQVDRTNWVLYLQLVGGFSHSSNKPCHLGAGALRGLEAGSICGWGNKADERDACYQPPLKQPFIAISTRAADPSVHLHNWRETGVGNYSICV